MLVCSVQIVSHVGAQLMCTNMAFLRWPIYGGPYLPRQNLLFHGKNYFSTAKLTFSRQKLLFHGKTYFSTAKLKLPFHGETSYGDWQGFRIKMATAHSDNEDGVEDNTEEVLIKYYFYRGYQYEDILDLLATYHNIEISERTLRRRLQMHGLSRRNPEYDVDSIIQEIEGMLDGPDCIAGEACMA